MPLIYGEGEKAFSRLQRKIMKAYRDQSVLAWNLDVDYGSHNIADFLGHASLLATHPRQFRHC